MSPCLTPQPAHVLACDLLLDVSELAIGTIDYTRLARHPNRICCRLPTRLLHRRVSAVAFSSRDVYPAVMGVLWVQLTCDWLVFSNPVRLRYHGESDRLIPRQPNQPWKCALLLLLVTLWVRPSGVTADAASCTCFLGGLARLGARAGWQVGRLAGWQRGSRRLPLNDRVGRTIEP